MKNVLPIYWCGKVTWCLFSFTCIWRDTAAHRQVSWERLKLTMSLLCVLLSSLSLPVYGCLPWMTKQRLSFILYLFLFYLCCHFVWYFVSIIPISFLLWFYYNVCVCQYGCSSVFDGLFGLKGMTFERFHTIILSIFGSRLSV